MDNYTRFLTYDLSYAEAEDYNELYDLIEKYKGVRVTKSTYKIVTSDDWNMFKKKFKSVTSEGDNVKAIVSVKDEKTKVTYMEVRTIR